MTVSVSVCVQFMSYTEEVVRGSACKRRGGGGEGKETEVPWSAKRGSWERGKGGGRRGEKAKRLGSEALTCEQPTSAFKTSHRGRRGVFRPSFISS